MTMTEDENKQLSAIQRSVRYHDRRMLHFERLHRFTNFVAILLAGVVLMELAGRESPLWVKILAAVGAVLSAFDLVVGFSRRASIHHDFKRKFSELEQAMVGYADLKEIVRRRLAIEAEEPAIYRALDLLCSNEIASAQGWNRRENPEQFTPLPWYMRCTAQLLHWSNAGELAPGQPLNSCHGPGNVR